MSFFTRFPYTNANNINLDWILDQVKNVSEFAESESARIDAAASDASSALTSSASALAAANAANGTANSALITSTEANIAAAYAKNAAAETGRDLLTVFGSLEALHAAVAAGNFANINIGDYFSVPVSGTYKDYADNDTKSINTTFIFEVAAINAFRYTGPTAFTAPHIVLMLKDVVPVAMKMTGTRGVYYDTDATNSWLGSAMYQTLNAADGLAYLLPAALTAYLSPSVPGQVLTWASGAAAPTGKESIDRGMLFIPNTFEVFGGNAGYTGIANFWPCGCQWPLFAAGNKRVKLIAGGSRANWWLEDRIDVNHCLQIVANGCAFSRYDNNGSQYTAFACVMI